VPVVPTTAYGTVEDVLLDARAVANDMEVKGGDVLTDGAPFTMQFVNLSYRRIQAYMAQWGVETYAAYAWLLNIPANATGDPESRVIVSDSGTEITTPSGAGESSFATPILPDDWVAPLKLRERPNGSTIFATDMVRPSGGVTRYLSQGTYLYDWEWIDDVLRFRGATQAMDVEAKYEKRLPILSQVGDAVPIRGVDNAAAFVVVQLFSKSRGGAMADGFGMLGQQELDWAVNRSRREQQRIRRRRQPYRGMRGGNSHRRG
jgi:hypothetical protein